VGPIAGLDVKERKFLKDGVFWNVKPCGLVRTEFRRNIAPPSSGRQEMVN
jgi:hypothetical protein